MRALVTDSDEVRKGDVRDESFTSDFAKKGRLYFAGICLAVM